MKNLVLETLNHKGPIYIRLAKGGDEIITKKLKNLILVKLFHLENQKIF